MVMDAHVLEGLRLSCLDSLKALQKQITSPDVSITTRPSVQSLLISVHLSITTRCDSLPALNSQKIPLYTFNRN